MPRITLTEARVKMLKRPLQEGPATPYHENRCRPRGRDFELIRGSLSVTVRKTGTADGEYRTPCEQAQEQGRARPAERRLSPDPSRRHPDAGSRNTSPAAPPSLGRCCPPGAWTLALSGALNRTALAVSILSPFGAVAIEKGKTMHRPIIAAMAAAVACAVVMSVPATGGEDKDAARSWTHKRAARA